MKQTNPSPPDNEEGFLKLALPETLGNMKLSVASKAVFLKLFMPPLFDGAYLAFNQDGDPVGVVNTNGTRILQSANGSSVEDLISDPSGAYDPDSIELVRKFLTLGLLQPDGIDEDVTGKAAWIQPDNAPMTRHTGAGADRFIRTFYDYFGSVFHDGSVLIDSHGDFLNAIARYFPTEPGKECLDAGCGSGHYTAALARLGHTVYGCDISVTRLEASRKKDAAPGKIIPVETDIEDIPLPDDSLDFVMCNFVLEHVADPFAVIDELVRLLRPGGTFLLAVPSFNIRDTLAAWLYKEPPSLNFEHLRSYGLIPETHPWCASTLDTINYLKSINTDIVQIEGANIMEGLWEPWLSHFQALAAQYGPAFETTWPWNCFGRQTIIFVRKREKVNE